MNKQEFTDALAQRLIDETATVSLAVIVPILSAIARPNLFEVQPL